MTHTTTHYPPQHTFSHTVVDSGPIFAAPVLHTHHVHHDVHTYGHTDMYVPDTTPAHYGGSAMYVPDTTPAHYGGSDIYVPDTGSGGNYGASDMYVPDTGSGGNYESDMYVPDA